MDPTGHCPNRAHPVKWDLLEAMDNPTIRTVPMIEGDTTQVTPVGRHEDYSTPRDALLLSPSGSLKDSLDALHARFAIPARFEVLGELGRGGMGIVYKVRDVETCEIVALKILKPEIAADPAMRESLRREVCMARKVTHRNVCRIHEFSRSETTACISMEYVDGESLLSKMQRRGMLSAIDTVEIASQICAGLREAHAQGIIHRDLKPANIVIAHDKTVKIMDFGVARRAHDNSESGETLAGTPAYMAPEQLEMKPITPRTDVYALGLMLYEMVTGEPAFKGETPIALALQQIKQSPARPSDLVPSIPARLEAAILKCLEKAPEKRFASVEELNVVLQKAIAPVTASGQTMVNLQPAKIVARTVGLAALADLKLLGKNIRYGVRETIRVARPQFAKFSCSIRNFDWRARPNRAMHAALFVTPVFCATVVFSLAIRQSTHAATNVRLAHSPIALSAPAVGAANLPIAEPTSPFDAKEFEFDATPPADSQPAAGTDAATAAKTVPPAHATVATAKKSKAKGPLLAMQPSVTHTPSEDNSADEALLATPDAGQLALDQRKEIPAALFALQPASFVNQDSTAAQANSEAGVVYLEVGSFNDSTWADDAVSKLDQLGFPALCVHKTHLWAQSYHVEVGPYQNVFDLDAAQKQLTAKGFKSHVVK
jgi:predicted Ser/Thr protein kinase